MYGLFPSRAQFNHSFPADVSEKNNAVSQWLLANILLPSPSSPGWGQQECVSPCLFSGYLPELGAARELQFQPHGSFYWHSSLG